MNLKKFISDNIIDIGDKTEGQEPAKQEAAPAHKDSSANKSFINKAAAAAYNSIDTHGSEPVSSDALTEARNRISKVLADSNKPGADYFEFVLTKNAMSSIPVEEERYKVAFAGLSATGLTKEVITNTANFYKTTIGNELKAFSDQFGLVYKSEVLDKKDAVAAKQKQMVQLSEQITRLNEEIKRLNDEIQRNESGFLMKKNAFEQAVSEAQMNIQNELDKINQYIK